MTSSSFVERPRGHEASGLSRLFGSIIHVGSKHRKKGNYGEANNLYYNAELKRWVERGKEAEAEASSVLPPPPVTVHHANTSGSTLNRRSLTQRYKLQDNLRVSSATIEGPAHSSLLSCSSSPNLLPKPPGLAGDFGTGGMFFMPPLPASTVDHSGILSPPCSTSSSSGPPSVSSDCGVLTYSIASTRTSSTESMYGGSSNTVTCVTDAMLFSALAESRSSASGTTCCCSSESDGVESAGGSSSSSDPSSDPVLAELRARYHSCDEQPTSTAYDPPAFAAAVLPPPSLPSLHSLQQCTGDVATERTALWAERFGSATSAAEDFGFGQQHRAPCVTILCSEEDEPTAGGAGSVSYLGRPVDSPIAAVEEGSASLGTAAKPCPSAGPFASSSSDSLFSTTACVLQAHPLRHDNAGQADDDDDPAASLLQSLAGLDAQVGAAAASGGAAAHEVTISRSSSLSLSFSDFAHLEALEPSAHAGQAVTTGAEGPVSGSFHHHPQQQHYEHYHNHQSHQQAQGELHGHLCFTNVVQYVLPSANLNSSLVELYPEEQQRKHQQQQEQEQGLEQVGKADGWYVQSTTGAATCCDAQVGIYRAAGCAEPSQQQQQQQSGLGQGSELDRAESFSFLPMIAVGVEETSTPTRLPGPPPCGQVGEQQLSEAGSSAPRAAVTTCGDTAGGALLTAPAVAAAAISLTPPAPASEPATALPPRPQNPLHPRPHPHLHFQSKPAVDLAAVDTAVALLKQLRGSLLPNCGPAAGRQVTVSGAKATPAGVSAHVAHSVAVSAAEAASRLGSSLAQALSCLVVPDPSMKGVGKQAGGVHGEVSRCAVPRRLQRGVRPLATVAEDPEAEASADAEEGGKGKDGSGDLQGVPTPAASPRCVAGKRRPSKASTSTCTAQTALPLRASRKPERVDKMRRMASDFAAVRGQVAASVGDHVALAGSVGMVAAKQVALERRWAAVRQQRAGLESQLQHERAEREALQLQVARERAEREELQRQLQLLRQQQDQQVAGSAEGSAAPAGRQSDPDEELLLCLGQESAKVGLLAEALRAAGGDPDSIIRQVEAEYEAMVLGAGGAT